MSDTVQTESGADVNALRNNFKKGESKELIVKSSKQLPDGQTWVVCAEIDAKDNDTDNCTIDPESLDWVPVDGEVALFTRLEDGSMQIGEVYDDSELDEDLLDDDIDETEETEEIDSI